MNNNLNNRQERIHYWGGSYISEKYGLKSFLNRKRGAKMPIKKNDIVFFYVPHDYAKSVGLLNSAFHVSVKSEEDRAEVMIAKFIENDEWGGVWLKPAKIAGSGIEIMIPRDAILHMAIVTKKEGVKQFGFKIPDDIKKMLDK